VGCGRGSSSRSVAGAVGATAAGFGVLEAVTFAFGLHDVAASEMLSQPFHGLSISADESHPV